MEPFQAHFLAAMLCLPRIMGIAFFVPFMRTQFIPGLVRNALLLVLAIFISPVALPGIYAGQAEELAWMYIAAKEMGIGLMMGFILGVVFYIPQMIGDFIDNQRGTSLGQVFNPAQGGQASQLGILLSLMYTTLFLVAGGFVAFVDILLQSYQAVGVFETVNADQAINAVINIFSDLIKIGILLAGPIVFTMLLAEFGLGIIGRFVQQLQVFFLAMPIKSVIALALMVIYIHVILRVYEENDFPLGPLKRLLIEFANG